MVGQDEVGKAWPIAGPRATRGVRACPHAAAGRAVVMLLLVAAPPLVAATAPPPGVLQGGTLLADAAPRELDVGLVGTKPGTAMHGFVVDALTQAPVTGARVVTGDGVLLTDAQGRFVVSAGIEVRGARAQGYRASGVPAAMADGVRIDLQPFSPKAVYLSHFGIGDTKKRRAALRLIAETEVNALVIDFKGDRGILPFRPPLPEGQGLPAPERVTVRNMPALIDELKAEGIYLIARIVVFKDPRLAADQPQLALRTRSGGVWQDREGLAWVDAFQPAVWDYNIHIAEAAARMGFDEIQFDYVRFPDAVSGPAFSQPSTRASRVAAISGFLTEARRRLQAFNVFVAADIFGYVCWNTDDTGIGQHIDALKEAVDYLAPMLYPSGFTWGIPGQRDPVADGGKIVDRTLRRCIERSALTGAHFRPWLQSFRDYAFDRRTFGAVEIRAQIDASEANGSNGWMLWNARNEYSVAGLKDNAGRLLEASVAVPVTETPRPAAP